ncbi:DUF4238 domain-containing protein [Cellvibrio zantedeschiae]|uniref:DUF4238 domain-containing protein n=1 Tax=Cellvibrio zantedeschiae TaxID=1237077 RepID=UPI00167C2BD8|nr:DUF4238 domain-containing protein [Cellvibrio zantedeschiae]
MSNELVKNQHVLPSKSIERFCNEKGMVQAHRIQGNNTFPANPRNKMFCVHRLWDQRAEQGYGKKIEDNYQSVVERVLASGCRVLSSKDNEIISEFYALWCLRSSIESYDESMSGNLVGVTGNTLTDEQKLNLELKQTIYIEEGGVVPMHFKRGITMQMAIDSFILRNPNLKWFVAQSKLLEFIVSDNPEGEFIIPFTPAQCFICSFHVPILSVEQVRRINMGAIMRSKFYYFARKLSVTLYA